MPTIITLLVLVVVAGIATVGYLLYNEYVKSQAEQERRTNLVGNNAEMTEVNQDKIYADYYSEYAAAKKEVYNSRPNEWNKAMLDKAYLVLVYNDKTGGIAEADQILGFIQSAADAGLNVDDNSWGFTQTDRDAFAKRVAERQQEFEANAQSTGELYTDPAEEGKHIERE